MGYCTVAELAVALGRPATAENSAAMQQCVDAAAAEIDHFVDRSEPIPAGDPLANRVNVLRAVEWWKANDAAFGVIGYDGTGSLYAPRDGFARHARTLRPLKQREGIA
jgi:hypothetical protein